MPLPNRVLFLPRETGFWKKKRDGLDFVRNKPHMLNMLWKSSSLTGFLKLTSRSQEKLNWRAQYELSQFQLTKTLELQPLSIIPRQIKRRMQLHINANVSVMVLNIRKLWNWYFNKKAGVKNVLSHTSFTEYVSYSWEKCLALSFKWWYFNLAQVLHSDQPSALVPLVLASHKLSIYMPNTHTFLLNAYIYTHYWYISHTHTFLKSKK